LTAVTAAVKSIELAKRRGISDTGKDGDDDADEDNEDSYMTPFQTFPFFPFSASSSSANLATIIPKRLIRSSSPVLL
jgi:hypothetical protein